MKCKKENSGQDVKLLVCLELRCCVLFYVLCGLCIDITIELSWVEFDERFDEKRWEYCVVRILVWAVLQHWYWTILMWILMRDFMRNFDNMVCKVYWVEFWWDIWWETLMIWCVKCIGSSSASCWSKVKLILSQLNEKNLAVYIIIPHGY